jgi:hypothetical protein
MRSTGQNPRYAQSTPGGFVLVSLYSWTVMTCGIVIARFIRGLLLHKIKFGADDKSALASIVSDQISSSCIWRTDVVQFVYIGTVVSWQHAVDAGIGKNITDIERQHALVFSRVRKSFLSLMTILNCLDCTCSAAPGDIYNALRKTILRFPHGSRGTTVSDS